MWEVAPVSAIHTEEAFSLSGLVGGSGISQVGAEMRILGVIGKGGSSGTCKLCTDHRGIQSRGRNSLLHLRRMITRDLGSGDRGSGNGQLEALSHGVSLAPTKVTSGFGEQCCTRWD